MIDEQYSRTIAIPGCHNMRDIGGYPAQGGTTRWRTLVRSASPHWMPADSWAAFHELGFHTLIDLRMPGEVAQENYRERLGPDVTYCLMPLFDENHERVGWWASSLSVLYCNMLEFCGDQFAGVLRAIAATPGQVLVHCAVGKDRTGMVVALALRAVGVANETVAGDYALSNALLSSLNAAFVEEVRARGDDTTETERIMESRYEVMIEVLEHLDMHYGGISAYLARIGLTDADVAQLQQKLIV